MLDYTEFLGEVKNHLKYTTLRKNITFIREANLQRVQLQGATQIFFLEDKEERGNSHVGHIQTKLTQNPSVYNKLKYGSTGRGLATRVTVLLAPPAVTKTKGH